MPTRENPPAGAPCWVDLSTSDVARARDFYTSVFGWTAQEPNPDFGGYFNFEHDGRLVAGCMASQPEQGDTADVWTVYLATDDAEKTLAAATDKGAQVIVPAMPVGDLGTMACVIDSTGAFVGMWQPGSHKGFGAYGEPGTPSWFELHTRDYDGALAFYRNVFRWEDTTPMPDFRYSTFDVGGEQLAGVMDATQEDGDVPSHWAVYFGVKDTDAAVTTITELGGTVVSPAEDTPYGRLAVVTDCNGAAFRLVAANEAMPAK